MNCTTQRMLHVILLIASRSQPAYPVLLPKASIGHNVDNPVRPEALLPMMSGQVIARYPRCSINIKCNSLF
jgi:hypothetical protein